jgi:hypothetical protein
MKAGFVLSEEGKRMIVIRPKDPHIALKLAEIALEHNDSDLFQKMLLENEYTIVGFMWRSSQGKPHIVDKDATYVGEILPGDSFVTPSDPLS